MQQISKITLSNALPCVFAGAENDVPVVNSQLWLHHVEFDRGNSYMVEAESGTGKSSMCSFIYGNRRDYTGTIRFNDTNIRQYTVAEWCDIRRHHLALLPQEMRLFAELTALENIMIKNRLTDRYSESEILKLLGELEIDNKANQLAARLSIGQQQRVAIVRSLCQPFDFIILDEPVSHLDSRNNAIVAAMVKRVADQNNAGIITTSVGNPLLLKDAQHVKL
jgi:ABC-type lipoprotein export system ATPase subunit